jgi:hypothetical protein
LTAPTQQVGRRFRWKFNTKRMSLASAIGAMSFLLVLLAFWITWYVVFVLAGKKGKDAAKLREFVGLPQ